MALKQLVEDIKMHVKKLTLNADFIELYDVDNNLVTFYVADENAIVEGAQAGPDGEYLFADGKKIVIENGVIVKIETPEEKIEETVEEEKTEEVVNEEEKIEETEKVEEKETVEDPKDTRIAELEAEVEKLKADLEAEKAAVTEKEEEIKEIEDDLKEIQNFYTSIKKSASERGTEKEEKIHQFYFIKNKK